MTPSPTAPPAMEVPEPRAINGCCVAFAQRTSVTTAWVVSGTATARGHSRATPAASLYTARASSSLRKLP